MPLRRVIREIRIRRQFLQANTAVSRKRLQRQIPPKAVEQSYFAYLLQILDVAKAQVRREIIEPMPMLVAGGKLDDDRADSPADVRRRIEGLRISLHRGVTADDRLERSVRDFGQRTANFQGSQLQAQIRQAIGIEVPLTDPQYGARLRNWTTENVGLIKSIPGDMLDEVERLVISGVNSGQRPESLAKLVEERFNVSQSRAALIARDQVGKFYGAVQRARQTNLGIKAYVWRTSRDERVREEHADREGETFQWDDPPEDGHPGQPINCRCTAEPKLEDLLDMLEAA